MENIYIVGFMGTGKSSVGRQIARDRKMGFIDLDELIEEEEKMSIPDIFREKGEPHFRSLEKKVLRRVAQKDKQVVSCGGGVVIDPENINLMKQTGSIACLTATPEVIIKRTGKYTHRPLLNVPDPRQKVLALLAERQKFYCQADITVDTSDISIPEAAIQVLRSLSE